MEVDFFCVPPDFRSALVLLLTPFHACIHVYHPSFFKKKKFFFIKVHSPQKRQLRFQALELPLHVHSKLRLGRWRRQLLVQHVVAGIMKALAAQLLVVGGRRRVGRDWRRRRSVGGKGGGVGDDGLEKTGGAADAGGPVDAWFRGALGAGAVMMAGGWRRGREVLRKVGSHDGWFWRWWYLNEDWKKRCWKIWINKRWRCRQCSSSDISKKDSGLWRCYYMWDNKVRDWTRQRWN